jgi:hypothetical protein
MVVCDQPFEEADRPEFRHLLEYTHFRPSLKIPHRRAMKSWIMNMGEDTIEGTRKMIAVRLKILLMPLSAHSLFTYQELDCMVSFSLDAWTSGNGYGFLAIVMHYISNDWQMSTHYFHSAPQY